MFSKSLIAAAAVAAAVAGFSATQANAGVDFDVTVGLGGFGPGYYGDGYGDGYGYGYPGHGYPGYGYAGYPQYDDDDYGISCYRGKKIVRHANFKNVKTVECQGSSFTYLGWKYGDKFRVKVSSNSGNIISVKHLY